MTALAQFRSELADFWQKMPGIGWFLVLSALWSILFIFLGNATFGYVDTPSLFGWLDWVCSRKSGDEHIPYVLLVVLVLFWRKRVELVETPEEDVVAWAYARVAWNVFSFAGPLRISGMPVLPREDSSLGYTG